MYICFDCVCENWLHLLYIPLIGADGVLTRYIIHIMHAQTAQIDKIDTHQFASTAIDMFQ